MISSSNVPAGSKYVHVGCHEDGVGEVQVGKRVFHQCSERFEESPRGGPLHNAAGRDTVGGAGHQVFHDIPEQIDVEEHVFS